jgi:hypothetical protein
METNTVIEQVAMGIKIGPPNPNGVHQTPSPNEKNVKRKKVYNPSS